MKFLETCSACVVMASAGYPGSYEKGKVIVGVEEAGKYGTVYHAGTARRGDNALITSGGRVLCVSSLGRSLRQALRNCYKGVGAIKFEGAFYRSDIGSKDAGAKEE